jgi:transposase
MDYDFDMIEHIDAAMPKMEWTILKSAKHHDSHALALLRTVKGLGPILCLTILYEIHTIKRFPTVQKFSSYARVVKVERSSHGKMCGSKNNKIGNPYLRWAFAQLAISAQRFYPSMKEHTQRLIKKFGMRKAYSLLAHKFAVAVYYMLKNKTVFDIKQFTAA